MKTKFKLAQHTNDEILNNILRQIEDNMATRDDVQTRAVKTVQLQKSAPNVKSLSDGDEVAYDDGTNVFLYRRIGGKLFKVQLTQV